MALFSARKEKIHIAQFAPILLLAAAILLLAVSAATLSDSNASREREIMEQALTRSITQCYALEGTYPPNLDYLSKNYGFTYNDTLFFIDYRYVGGNLRPSVTIIEREQK